MPLIEICSTCRFFLLRGSASAALDLSHEAEAPDVGICRRSPPVMVPDDPEIGIAVSVFPKVHRDHWCGEWMGSPRLTHPLRKGA